MVSNYRAASSGSMACFDSHSEGDESHEHGGLGDARPLAVNANLDYPLACYEHPAERVLKRFIGDIVSDWLMCSNLERVLMTLNLVRSRLQVRGRR